MISPGKAVDYWVRALVGVYLTPWSKRGEVPPAHLLTWKYPEILFPETIVNPHHYIFLWFCHQYQRWIYYFIQRKSMVMYEKSSLVNSSHISFPLARNPWWRLSIYPSLLPIHHLPRKSVVAASSTCRCIWYSEHCCIWSSHFPVPSSTSSEEIGDKSGKMSDKGIFKWHWFPYPGRKIRNQPLTGKILGHFKDNKFYSSFRP